MTAPLPAPLRVLLLGGTAEATAIAAALGAHPDRYDLTVSFAGRTGAPRAPAGTIRIGGFGGVAGLATHLRDEAVDVLVDATHPFAAVMRWNASTAAVDAGIPHLRVERPGWVAQAGDRWHRVADLADAPAALVALGAARIFLTTGRQELAPFAALPDAWFLLRSIEPPGPLPFPHAEVVLDRGPFTVAGELDLLRRHRIDALVTKDSGADATAAKLAAARELAVPVVMVDRPPNPPGPLVTTAADALAWLDALPT